MSKEFKRKSWAHSAWNTLKDGDKVLGRARYQIELTDEATGYEFYPKVDIRKEHDKNECDECLENMRVY